MLLLGASVSNREPGGADEPLGLKRQLFDVGRTSILSRGRFRLGWAQSPSAPPPLLEVEDATILFDGLLFGPSASTNHGGQPSTSVHHRLTSLWVDHRGGWLDYLDGDIAIVRLDLEAEAFVLSRSPVCSRPLFYLRSGFGWEVASSPVTTGPPQDRFDLTALAERMLPEGPTVGPVSVLNGWRAVPPGCEVTLSPTGATIRRVWAADRIEAGSITLEAAASRLREQLARNVAISIRPGATAVHLSGGRDSTAVAVCAAISGHRCVAVTSAPIADCEPWGPQWDESQTASRVADVWPILDHVIARPSSTDLPRWLDAIHRIHPEPLASPVAIPWWVASHQLLREKGIECLLVGHGGNFGLSLGGTPFLADLVRAGQWHLAYSIARTMESTWRERCKRALLPLLPRTAHRWLTKWRARRSAPGLFLKGALRQHCEWRAEELAAQASSHPDYRSWVVHTLNQLDHADKFTEVLQGVEVIDPTIGREILETALSLQVEDLASVDTARPAYDLAFAGLIPDEVLANPTRGRQNLDYHLTIDLDALRDGLDRYRSNSLAAEWVDFDAIDGALDGWPTSRDEALRHYRRYAVDLLGAVALASFLYVRSSEGAPDPSLGGGASLSPSS